MRVDNASLRAPKRSGDALGQVGLKNARFITTELLEHLDPASREVLRAASLLPAFSAKMVSEVSGRSDAAEVIAARMERARAEISHWDGYDYVIINHAVDVCFEKVRAILEAERMKRARQTGLIPFVRGLMG